jgi:hypothetical protein
MSCQWLRQKFKKGNESVKRSAKSRGTIPFQRWRMHALAWWIWSARGNEVEQMQDEGLAGSPVAGLMAQIRDEQLAGTPAAGLMEQIQGEPLGGDLAAGLARTGAPSRAHWSFSQCKMTQCPNPNPNPNLSRS